MTMNMPPLDRLQLALYRHRPQRWLPRAGWVVANYSLALARDFVGGEISLRAMSLVYTTLLSLVPLLALAFSLLKALGVHHGLDTILRNLLQPLGPDADKLTAQVLGFVDKVQVGVLGTLGVAFLLYSAISLISKVESSFNFLWEVNARSVSLQRFSEYIAVLVVGPLVVFSAIGMTASLRNQHVISQILASGPFGDMVMWLSKVVPYLLMVGVFIFIYSFMPNIRVRLKSAVVGGLFTGVVWQTASVVFATFVGRASNYNAIYSSFAILIFLLLWIYVGWLIVLVGCRLSFYVQHPHRMLPRKPGAHGGRARETLVLVVFALVARRYLAGQAPWNAAQLPSRLAVGQQELQEALNLLLDGRLLAESLPRHDLLPARDLSAVNVADVWRCARGDAGGRLGPDSELADAFITRAEAAVDDGLTVREWLEQTAVDTSVERRVAIG